LAKLLGIPLNELKVALLVQGGFFLNFAEEFFRNKGIRKTPIGGCKGEN